MNTGIRTTGATFGVQAFTSGLAGGINAPAAIYAENTGTTNGDVLRLYTSSMTSAPSMANIYQEISTFTGTALTMNMGLNGGSFTGKFVDFKNASSTKFMIDSAGKVGVGTSTLSSALVTVAGDIRVGNSGTNGCIQGFGGATLVGTCTSDQNLKTNIADVSNLLERFQALRVINYTWNDTANAVYGNSTTSVQTGYLAQNVESIFPELVSTTTEGYKQVNYTALGLYAVEGVKELSIANSEASSTLFSLLGTVTNNYIEASSSILDLSNTFSSKYQEASSSISTLLALISSNYNEASSTFATVLGNISSVQSTTTELASQISGITNVLNITNAPTNALTITSSGVVGIGNDGTQIDDELVRISGRVRAQGFDIDAAADLSENFPASEAVDAGTVVAFSSTTIAWNATHSSSTEDTYNMSTVRKAVSGYEAVGVVSTKAGIVLGGKVANGVPVAFSGRIPVKVTTENGIVKQGDYLTVSKTIPGYAMKLTEEGRSIGRALSDYETGREKVLMFVENGNQKLDVTGNHATTTGMLTIGNIDLNANGVAITNIKSLASANGTWSIDENGRIVGKIICLDDICIDKNTLTNMLNISGQSTVLGASTSTTPTDTSTSTPTDTSTSTPTDTSTSTPTDTSTSTPTDTSTSTPTDTSTSTQTVIIDTTAPSISILGESSISIPVGVAYIDQGATALDDTDGDITSNIVTTSTVDIGTIGSYSVNYSVSDTAGNTTVITRVVDVVPGGQ